MADKNLSGLMIAFLSSTTHYYSPEQVQLSLYFNGKIGTGTVQVLKNPASERRDQLKSGFLYRNNPSSLAFSIASLRLSTLNFV